jgi:hypothetical protein
MTNCAYLGLLKQHWLEFKSLELLLDQSAKMVNLFYNLSKSLPVFPFTKVLLHFEELCDSRVECPFPAHKFPWNLSVNHEFPLKFVGQSITHSRVCCCCCDVKMRTWVLATRFDQQSFFVSSYLTHLRLHTTCTPGEVVTIARGKSIAQICQISSKNKSKSSLFLW